jgi:4-oxalocrotonate tautomerase
VTVEMWEGRGLDQKRALVRAITEAMVQHAGAQPDHLHVIIHEISKQNWGRAGRLGCDQEEARAGPDEPVVLGLTHLLMQVRDLGAAERFFVDVLGFAVRDRSVLRDGRPLVVLRQGLGLTVFPPGAAPTDRTVDHIAFRVRDLAPIVRRITQEAVPYEGPVTTPTYGTSIYVRDPDGNRIELHDR